MSKPLKAIVDAFRGGLKELAGKYEVCGLIDKSGQIYPLGADTKVLPYRPDEGHAARI